MKRFFASALAVAWLAGCAAPATDWKASWGTALMVPNDKVALAAAHRRDVTLRQAMRLSLGGEALRVRISNLHGAEPLVIDAASVGHPARPGLGDIIDPLAVAGSVMSRYQVAGIEVQALLATARWRMRFRWRGSARAGNLGGFYH